MQWPCIKPSEVKNLRLNHC